MRRMRRYRGATMALYTMFIAFVGVPLLGVTVDLSRVFVKRAELANAVEAACSAYTNTPDLDSLIQGGIPRLGDKARGQGYLFFGYNISGSGALTDMEYSVKNSGDDAVVTATCSGRASIRSIIFAGVVSFEVVKTVTVKAKYGTSTNWSGASP